MIVAALEPWLKFRNDSALPGLILEYGEEHGVTPDPDWPRMQRMAMVSELHVVTLRTSLLVGFCICVMRPQLGFKGKMLAFAELIFVRPEYRPDGTHLLLVETQKRMREHGASHFALHHAPAIASLGALGFGTSMRAWIKEL